MIILFAISLFLLVLLFALKLEEVNLGKKLVLRDLRDKSDNMLTFFLNQVEGKVRLVLRSTSDHIDDLVKNSKRSLSEFFEKLAHKLR